jgi:hypothetical protein
LCHQGKTDGTAIDLSAIDTRGFVINGEMGNDGSGYSVSTAGDVNGDGLDDVIVGANRADPIGRKDAGKSYVVFGKPIIKSSKPSPLTSPAEETD